MKTKAQKNRDRLDKLNKAAAVRKSKKKYDDLLQGCVHSRTLLSCLKSDKKEKDLLPVKPWEKRNENIIIEKTKLVRAKKEKPVKYTGEMLEREKKAQEEIEKKKMRIAPAYSKGAYQYITDDTDLTDLGRKK